MEKTNVHFFSFENFNEPGAAVNRHIALTKYSKRDNTNSFLYSVLHSADTKGNEQPINAVLPSSNKILKILKSILFAICSLLTIRKNLSKEDKNIVFYLGTSGVFFAIFYLMAKICGFKLYHERTELPSLMVGKSFIKKVDFGLYQLFVKKVDRLFVITQALKQHFISCGVNGQKVSILNMFVDFSRFDKPKKRSAPLSEQCFVITFCGDLTSSKDSVNILLEAVSDQISRGKNIRLKLIGDNNTKYFTDILQPLILKLGIDKNVDLIGLIPASDVPKQLTESDLLALSRNNSEQAKYGFPTKLGEYLATGVPVIVTKTGEIDAFLVDGDSAYLVQPGCVSALAQRISSVLDDYSKAINVANNGVDVAFKYFNAELVVEEIFSE
ncbi:glycosyltransferase [Pseudoalteromonas aurantia]|uniref:Glycosyl transferase family 1 domain-containing protein n=1 Tax=Pseudoalteromonas aurantia 208 TaxID=1314867 RepID=A0ABR9EFS0_9GAMM|nr:glycosyltransferase [Pseudoalteromonas aurantia]MBE0369259.1 hypothetical protein [Pseudoalteromonas aurantia 208]